MGERVTLWVTNSSSTVIATVSPPSVVLVDTGLPPTGTATATATMLADASTMTSPASSAASNTSSSAAHETSGNGGGTPLDISQPGAAAGVTKQAGTLLMLAITLIIIAVVF